MSVRLITRDGQFVPSEIHTFAFAFFPGGLVAFRNGVEVTPGEAMMCLADNIARVLADRDARAEALSQPGAIR